MSRWWDSPREQSQVSLHWTPFLEAPVFIGWFVYRKISFIRHMYVLLCSGAVITLRSTPEFYLYAVLYFGTALKSSSVDALPAPGFIIMISYVLNLEERNNTADFSVMVKSMFRSCHPNSTVNARETSDFCSMLVYSRSGSLYKNIANAIRMTDNYSISFGVVIKFWGLCESKALISEHSAILNLQMFKA